MRIYSQLKGGGGVDSLLGFTDQITELDIPLIIGYLIVIMKLCGLD